MKKWKIAAPVVGVLSFGALGVFVAGLFQEQAAPAVSVISAPIAAVERQLPSMSVAEAAEGFVSYEEIKAKAIAESGLKERALTNYEIKFDSRGYMPLYKVELETNERGIDMDFDARTGELISVRESSWKHPRTKLVISDYSVVGDARALSTALSDAGLALDSLDRYELELHTKMSELVYSIELKSGAEEYEYTVRAADGVILKKEVDRD
ncbi:hypothetical protein TAMA11512_22780 [Selenomonas sp. TAMA-11512]|uniref:PepSY domain-containing protein n=1 Tax=Selenomonas sp. TAMA-11512 TaxID=3095337 RepID=UPI00308E4E6B|nr:hypothetical protein TAMA11512_22780 [Selenomonas sp. TAMA-11512]